MSKALLLAVLSEGKQKLEEANVVSPQLEAEILLSRLCEIKRHDLYLKENVVLFEGFESVFMEMIKKRCQGMPIQYITGVESFMGMDFKVSNSTLIPRPDTEILVTSVLKYAKEFKGGLRILDLCTGSGNIAVSLAKLVPDAHVWAIDISLDAIEVARENARLNGIEGKIEFLVGDMFCPLAKQQVFDIIVSNPPYIRSGDISMLEPHVKLHEPMIALDGGMDGLDFYRVIIANSFLYLKSGGLLGVEAGHDQAESIASMLESIGNYREIEMVKDLALIDRVVLAKAK